jgi:hypothetical protein
LIANFEIERLGEGYSGVAQVPLLFPRQETRRIAVRGGSIIADNLRGTNREILVGLTDLVH